MDTQPMNSSGNSQVSFPANPTFWVIALIAAILNAANGLIQAPIWLIGLAIGSSLSDRQPSVWSSISSWIFILALILVLVGSIVLVIDIAKRRYNDMLWAWIVLGVSVIPMLINIPDVISGRLSAKDFVQTLLVGPVLDTVVLLFYFNVKKRSSGIRP